MNTINKKNDVRDIINSIRFYIMLDIVVGNSDSTKTSTYKFLKEVREKSGFLMRKLITMRNLLLKVCQVALEKFLKFHQSESFNFYYKK